MSKRVYIAIEIMSRELHGKVLLACIAAEKGYSAVIGNSAEMRDALRQWKPGTIVWKGLVKKAQKNYQLFHQLGHTVVAQCEEGLVYPSADFYTKLRVSGEALDELDIFFAWGENQGNDILDKFPEQKEKIILAGNPRIDLLEKRFRAVFNKEVDAIKERYSPYILVNTNFSSFTHSIGPEAVIQRLKDKGTIKTAEEEEFYRGRSENREKLFHEFVQMLESLNASFSGYNIILRPHPSEDIVLWKKSLSHLKKVQVVREGSAIPWIIGSELMIHNDCTTAIEASLLDKTVISYRPTANNPYESKLAVSVGVSTETIDELKLAINDVLDGETGSQQEITANSKDALKRFISSIDNEPACEVIVNHIERLYVNDTNQPRKTLLTKLKMIARRNRYKLIHYKKARAVKKINDNDSDLKRQTNKSLELSDVRRIIGELNINSNLFNDLDVVPVQGTDTCFTILKR